MLAMSFSLVEPFGGAAGGGFAPRRQGVGVPGELSSRSIRRQLAAKEGDSRQASQRRVERLANFLDASWRIPGLGTRFGADAVIGLVPVVGDFTSLIISAYLVREAHQAGAGLGVLARMVGNVGVDAVLGSIPLVGDLFDVYFKANQRNAALLRKALHQSQQS